MTLLPIRVPHLAILVGLLLAVSQSDATDKPSSCLSAKKETSDASKANNARQFTSIEAYLGQDVDKVIKGSRVDASGSGSASSGSEGSKLESGSRGFGYHPLSYGYTNLGFPPMHPPYMPQGSPSYRQLGYGQGSAYGPSAYPYPHGHALPPYPIAPVFYEFLEYKRPQRGQYKKLNRYGPPGSYKGSTIAYDEPSNYYERPSLPEPAHEDPPYGEYSTTAAPVEKVSKVEEVKAEVKTEEVVKSLPDLKGELVDKLAEKVEGVEKLLDKSEDTSEARSVTSKTGNASRGVSSVVTKVDDVTKPLSVDLQNASTKVEPTSTTATSDARALPIELKSTTAAPSSVEANATDASSPAPSSVAPTTTQVEQPSSSATTEAAKTTT